MTIKEVFKMVESYNNVSELMGTNKIKVCWVTRDGGISFVEGKFSDYKSFRWFVRRNYFPTLVESIGKYKNWDFNNGGNFTEYAFLEWGWDNENTSIFRIELVFD